MRIPIQILTFRLKDVRMLFCRNQTFHKPMAPVPINELGLFWINYFFHKENISERPFSFHEQIRGRGKNMHEMLAFPYPGKYFHFSVIVLVAWVRRKMDQ